MNKTLQKRVAAFVEAHRLETDVAHRVLDLVSEIGEVAKEVLKSTRYGKKRFTPDDNWGAEIRDVLFSIICVANMTGVHLETALLNALKKYEHRIKTKKDAGSGK